MGFISSNISITNRVEQAALYFYNGGLSQHFEQLKPILQPIEQEIFSRIVGLLISPAALLEIALHVVILPFTVIYAIGKRIYRGESGNEYYIPWHHIQRIRDAVFPVLFGSLFGLIHPYLGTYAAEPVKKHIATGILLSGTNTADFNTVCSPLTTMSELTSLLAEVPPPLDMNEDEEKLLERVSSWEGELEKIQSIDFFSLNLTLKLSHKIQQVIEKSELPTLVKEVAKRISLITYPIFMVLDLVVFAFATVVCLGALVVKLLGGQSPAYLEKAWTPEVLIYNLVKIPLFIISATVGFIVSIFHPETGHLCLKYPMEWMAKLPFFLKMQFLERRLNKMEVGELILLPAVQTYSENPSNENLHLLPSYGSHMRYLLVEKVNESEYQIELIERGERHGKTAYLTQEKMNELVQNTLALRYKFGAEGKSVLDAFNDNSSIIDLGTQTDINNCIVTNLFAAIEVLQKRYGNELFNDLCYQVRSHAEIKNYLYAFDFYPFGETSAIIKEITESAEKTI